jgi:hypothetical protein
MIESSNVEVTTENVVITIPNRVFRFLNGTGVILFRLNTTIAATGDSLPILFSSNDFTQNLTLAGGTNAVGTDLVGPGVHVIYYDKGGNVLQLIY